MNHSNEELFNEVVSVSSTTLQPPPILNRVAQTTNDYNISNNIIYGKLNMIENEINDIKIMINKIYSYQTSFSIPPELHNQP